MASQIRAEREAISYACDVPMNSPSSSSRSNPEQNVPSRPRITITRTWSSSSARCRARSSSSSSCWLTALRLCGRLSQIRATCPSTSYWIGSASMIGMTASLVVGGALA
jgi:hypothetical protein